MNQHVSQNNSNHEVPHTPPGARAMVYGVLLILFVSYMQKYISTSVSKILDWMYRRGSQSGHLLLRITRFCLGMNNSQASGATNESSSSLTSLHNKITTLSGMNRIGGITSGLPPGLGNLDSSCYQNSVIQAFTSLSPFRKFLEQHTAGSETLSMSSSLLEMMETLSDQDNAGRLFWLPTKLKNMSSWQQQDAQEYFSKILTEIEGEVAKSFLQHPRLDGLADVSKFAGRPPGASRETGGNANTRSREISNSTSSNNHATSDPMSVASNPMEGFTVQRVSCLQCGYSSGLSMIPFQCLTLSMRDEWACRLETCLDDFGSLEILDDVECPKCTILEYDAKLKLSKLHSIETSDTTSSDSAYLAWVETLRLRHEVLETALDTEDFSDDVINKCQIPKKQRVNRRKTKQTAIGRAPQCLAIHVNRSIFDEQTGMQRKNTASLQFPRQWRLEPWCLGWKPHAQGTEQSASEACERWPMSPNESLTSGHTDINDARNIYDLKAVITHHGRHENGHYICYRQAAKWSEVSSSEDADKRPWWRFNDETVSEVDEEFVLSQGGVFMLFYEKIRDRDSTRTSCHPSSSETEDNEERGSKPLESTTPSGTTKPATCSVPDLIESTDTVDNSSPTVSKRSEIGTGVAPTTDKWTQKANWQQAGKTPLETSSPMQSVYRQVPINQNPSKEVMGLTHRLVANSPMRPSRLESSSGKTPEQAMDFSQNLLSRQGSKNLTAVHHIPTPPRSEGDVAEDSAQDYPHVVPPAPTVVYPQPITQQRYPSPPASPSSLQIWKREQSELMNT